MSDSNKNSHIALIETAYSKEQAKNFELDIIDNDRAMILQKCCVQIMQVFPPQSFCCAYVSAMLVELARREGIESYLVAGTLDFEGRRLFDYDPIIESSNIQTKWNGHCWAVFNNTIGDVSFFRTAYSDQVPSWLKNLVIANFGQGRGALLATHLEMDSMGLHYSPKYVFCDNKLDGLLNSAESIIAHYWKLPLSEAS